MPHFIPIKSGFGKKDDCGEWLRTKEPFPIDRRFGFGPEWMWQPCSCRPTTGSPQSVTTPLVCPPREETPMHTGTVGSSHSLFFFQCFHQLPYLMDLGSEWVFCPGRALQCSELELGIILWGKLFLPCTLWPFPHFFRFCQFKKREQQLLSGRYCRSGLERLSYFFFFILLYVRCPEITQKITGLGESRLKITEHLLKFLPGSKINTELHRLCPVVHVLTLSCSPVLDLFFYVVIRLESSFENKTKPPLPPNLDAHGYLKTKQHFKSNSWVCHILGWKLISVLVWRSKIFPEIEGISNGSDCCLGGEELQTTYCKTTSRW